jgi:hypothetical protein
LRVVARAIVQHHAQARLQYVVARARLKARLEEGGIGQRPDLRLIAFVAGEIIRQKGNAYA